MAKASYTAEEHEAEIAWLKKRAETRYAKLEIMLHEAVVAVIADRLIAAGREKATKKDVIATARGKFQRASLPVFTEQEIAFLRKALHPDGKPASLHKLFNDASCSVQRPR
jgi:hypothetical protein